MESETEPENERPGSGGGHNGAGRGLGSGPDNTPDIPDGRRGDDGGRGAGRGRRRRTEGRGGADGRGAGGRRIGRRGLLLGSAAVLVGGGVLAQDSLARIWWRMPGMTRPRKEGELDHAGAQWTAAARANWRLADRPDDYRIDRVIIHVVQGSFPTALRVFKNPGHGAATHYVVGKDGKVAQMIRELDVAFHAGNRSFNERSIGIEHEGFVDRPKDFTDEMYAASAKLTAGICVRYDLPVDRTHIIGHVEVPGTDHTDPGPHWDWKRYLELVRAAVPEARAAKAAEAGG
ncbi:N-acetylmuramoyl-L-alanine amidase [Streptomyces qinzhouensis]|uniref:N-acetylmuramoyl-L-alanine amidase n=1 Tax=Streptomyces qinzhouensis TaxID=2599401 RepID=A0A5B8INM4_9ACTN|nr:N-acetylmuramoyl-L-alanine amidase [Streptomyces qinzhouensis]